MKNESAVIHSPHTLPVRGEFCEEVASRRARVARARGRRAGRRRNTHPREHRRELACRGRWLSGPAGGDAPERGHVRPDLAQLQPLRVVARGQARHRDDRRLVEVLRRPLLDVLRLPSRRLFDAQRDACGERPDARFRLRVERGHTGDAARLDEQHRPERRLGHEGPGLRAQPAVQRRSGPGACTRTAQSR